MVLEDFSLPERGAVPRGGSFQSSSHEERGPWPASPRDRLAATVADFIVFLPILALVIAPFSREAREAQILGSEEAWSAAVGSALAAGFFALLVYQTLTVLVFGATPGKLALGLRVVSTSLPGGHRPRPIEAFLRALFWCLEVCLLGIPWLAVFSNERRRPVHDRVADTEVVTYSKSRRAVPAEPSLVEMSLASGFQSATLAVCAMVLTVEITRIQTRYASLESKIMRLEEEGYVCPEIKEAIDKSSVRRLDSTKDRLETALSLYLSGAVEKICVEAEAELALWKNEEAPLAYFAKAVAFEDIEKAEPYFEKACDESMRGDVCKAVALIRGSVREAEEEGERDRDAENQHERETLKVLTSIDETSPDYLRTLAVRYLVEKRDNESALSLLDAAMSFDGARDFAAQERAKALWRLGRKEEARAALTSALFLLGPEGRLNLAQWFCRNEVLASGCSSESTAACSQVREAVNDNEAWLHRPEIASAYLHTVSCSAKEESLQSLTERLPFMTGRRVAAALLKAQKGERREAVLELQEILKGSSSNRGVFLTDANVLLASIAENTDELAPVQSAWSRMDERSEGWLTVGRSLLKNLVRLGSWDAALTTGLKLRQEDRFDRESLELTLLAAKKAGRPIVEQTLLTGAERRPSSLQKRSRK